MEAELTGLFLYLEAHLFVAAGVFARIGALAFLVPGLGERALSIRIRLGAALAITFILAPLIPQLTMPVPQTPFGLAYILISEAIVGLVLGLAFRLLVFALQIAGMVAAQHISVAQMLGSGVAPEPEPTIATLLASAGIVLAMLLGLHVQLIASLADSYRVFPFGFFPAGAPTAAWASRAMTDTFALGITLAAPFVAIGFAYNVALGALNRAMPQLLVALVGVPFLVWLGMVVLYLVLPSILGTWQGHLDSVFLDPIRGWR